MRAEHPAALKYIFQDEIYLLPGEKPVTLQATDQPVAEPAPPATIEALPATGTEPPTPVAEVKPEVQTPAVQFNYLGANKKAFLIVTHYPDLDFIADEHLTALQNILKRKEHELNDVAILNLAKSPVNDWGELLTHFTPKKVLLLGKNAVPAKLELPALNRLTQTPAYGLLYSFSFDEMMSSTDNKKAFWEQMKNL